MNKRIVMVESLTDQANEGSEYTSEIFDSFHSISGIVLRPNIQYIVHPGGRSDHGDAIVLGLKTAIDYDASY